MKPIITAFLCLLFGFSGFCQYGNSNKISGELGVSLSALNCNTDVEGKPLDVKNFRPGGGIYGTLLYRNFLGLRLEATMGSVIASDKQSTDKAIKRRNLSFKSDIKEISLIAELHPLELKYKENYSPALSIYFLAGVGYFSFNPEAKLNRKWIALQPLRTEGQGFPETKHPEYKLSQICLPVGAGVQYNLSDRFVLRGEAVYRILRTDYLDDVSTNYIRPSLFDKYLSPEDAELAKRLFDRSAEQGGNEANHPGERRGNPKNNDAYYSLNIKLGIKLHKAEGNYVAKRARRATGCYRF